MHFMARGPRGAIVISLGLLEFSSSLPGIQVVLAAARRSCPLLVIFVLTSPWNRQGSRLLSLIRAVPSTRPRAAEAISHGITSLFSYHDLSSLSLLRLDFLSGEYFNIPLSPFNYQYLPLHLLLYAGYLIISLTE